MKFINIYYFYLSANNVTGVFKHNSSIPVYMKLSPCKNINDLYVWTILNVVTVTWNCELHGIAYFKLGNKSMSSPCCVFIFLSFSNALAKLS